MNLLDRLVENAQNGHAALTGQPMDEQALAALAGPACGPWCMPFLSGG